MSKEALPLPKAHIPGMIPTLNDTGFMTDEPDAYSLEFAAYAGSIRAPTLDIGCAYGVATIAALAEGATVTACDMEERHLEILASRVPEEARGRLTTAVGVLPYKDFPEASFGAVLAARVLHFLTGPAIEESVSKMAVWLAPEGRLFLITDTAYAGLWRAYAPEYERLKAEGHPWPGEIHDAQRFLPEPARQRSRVRYMNFLDPGILRRVCEGAGLVVEKCGWIGPGAHERGKAYGDKERAGVVARKPGK